MIFLSDIFNDDILCATYYPYSKYSVAYEICLYTVGPASADDVGNKSFRGYVICRFGNAGVVEVVAIVVPADGVTPLGATNRHMTQS